MKNVQNIQNSQFAGADGTFVVMPKKVAVREIAPNIKESRADYLRSLWVKQLVLKHEAKRNQYFEHHPLEASMGKNFFDKK